MYKCERGIAADNKNVITSLQKRVNSKEVGVIEKLHFGICVPQVIAILQRDRGVATEALPAWQMGVGTDWWKMECGK
jgi:hypothetical protein